MGRGGRNEAEKAPWFRQRDRNPGLKFRCQIAMDNDVLDFFCFEKLLAINGVGHTLRRGALRESPYPGEAELISFPRLAEWLGMERSKKTTATEAVGHTIDAGHDGKAEILAE